MRGTVNKSIRVLLVDDDEDDYLIIRNFINKIHESPFKFEWVSGAAEAAAIIEK